ncbi:Synaptojanin-2 [Bienertia sinuspersici]
MNWNDHETLHCIPSPVRVEKFRLTEEEEDEIDLDDIPGEELECQGNLALVGKLFTQNASNVEAMKSVLRASWKPTKGMAVREIDKNLEKVIEQGQWAFNNHLLLLKEISGKEQPRDLIFECAYFWVKVYNVPFVKRTRTLAIAIGNKQGKYLDFDEADILGWSSGEKIWVDFRIERLPGFCYVCGCLGHSMKECDDYDEESP